VVLVVLVVLANDHLIMITAHFPLFFLKIRHFFYRYQLVDPKDPTYNNFLYRSDCIYEKFIPQNVSAESLTYYSVPLPFSVFRE
ncbi:MAG: hypothetical protein ACRC5A_08165, partial [Enterobacteriaceae bacterium]